MPYRLTKSVVLPTAFAAAAAAGGSYLLSPPGALLAPLLLTALTPLAVQLVLLRRADRALAELSGKAGRLASGAEPPKARAEELESAIDTLGAALEESIRQNRSKHQELDAILLSVGEGVLAIDAEGKILTVNPVAAELLHLPWPTPAGTELVNAGRARRVTDMVRQVLRTELPARSELVLQLEDERVIELRGTVLRDAENQKLGVVLVMSDVTQIRQLERVTRDFVANVSHELRTPITSVQGFVETLLDGALEDQSVRRHFLEIVLHQAGRLRAIIDDLLVLARVESLEQGYEIETGPVRLAELLRSVASLCGQRAAAKSVTIDVRADEDLVINANRLLLEQALVNLVNNAITYNNVQGRVDVRAVQHDDRVELSVTDTGIGIPEEHLPRLFERFYRVDKGRSRQDGGSGLGLAIVKHIAAVHGGTVMVESIAGKGSAFSIHLPQAFSRLPARALAVGE